VRETRVARFLYQPLAFNAMRIRIIDVKKEVVKKMVFEQTKFDIYSSFYFDMGRNNMRSNEFRHIPRTRIAIRNQFMNKFLKICTLAPIVQKEEF